MAVSKEVVQLDVKIGGKQAGQTLNQLQKESRSLNAQIRNLTPGTKKFIDTSARLKKVNGDMKKLKGEIYGVQKSQAALNAQNLRNIESTGLYSTQLTMLRTSMVAAKSGALLFIGSLKTLRGALIATGIGAFVVVLGSLISYFTQTKRGVDLINAVSAALGATWSVLVDRASAMGEAIVKAVSNPKQLIIDLGNLLKDQIINRFKAFAVIGDAVIKILDGDLKEGFKQLGDGTLQLTTGVENMTDKMADFGNSIKDVTKEIVDETSAAFQLEQQYQRLRDRQIELTVERARTKNEIEKLRFAGRDLANSAQERLEFIKQAGELEEKLVAKEIAAAKEAVKVQEDQMDLSENLLEDEQKLADLKVTLAQTEQKSWKLRRTLKMEEITLLKEIAATEKAEEDRKAAKAEEEALKIEEEDAAELERQRVNAENLRQVKNEARLAELEDTREGALMELEIAKQAELDKVQNAENAGELKAAIHKKYKQKEAAVNKQFDEQEREERRQRIADKVAEVNQYASLTAGLLTAASEFQERGSEEWKRSQRAATVINGASAAIRAFAELGPIQGSLAAATIALTTAKRLGDIDSVQPPTKQTYNAPQFASGGFTGSGAGIDSSGHRVAGVVHDNEYVIPKVMVQDAQFADTIAMLESERQQRVGGFAEGGNTSPNSNNSTTELTKAIKALNARLSQPILAVYDDEEAAQIRELIQDIDESEAEVAAS